MLVGIALVFQQSIGRTSSIYATSKSPRESGYDHGCDDARISDQDDRYINQPEKGPSYHTSEFMDGYYDGFSGCGGNGRGDLISLNPISEITNRLLIDKEVLTGLASVVTHMSSCDDLVNSDNTLTPDGDRAVGCIRNGIL